MMIFLNMLETEEEKDLFMQVYEQNKHFMWYVANGLLCDAHLAEDAVQEAFLALTRHMDKINSPDSSQTKALLATIVKNKAVDLLRKKHPEELYAKEDEQPEYEDGAPDMLDQYITEENYRYVLECIGQLDEIYKIVFEYKYLHHMTDREIARLLGITPKTVNVRIFRARKKLQKLLEKGGGMCGIK